MPKNKKEIIIWSVVGAAVVIAIIIAAVVSRRHKAAVLTGSSGQPASSASVQPSQPTSTPASASAVKSAVKYTDLVAEYQGRLIQFNPSCQATPNNATFRSPVTIMLDNRSAHSAKITVGGAVHNLVAWGYYITTLSSGSLPKTDLVDCNSSVNVAQILLQK